MCCTVVVTQKGGPISETALSTLQKRSGQKETNVTPSEQDVGLEEPSETAIL